MAGLSPRQLQLLAFLKVSEKQGRSFTVEEAAQASQLSEVSVRTYFSKKLNDIVVFRVDDKHFAARGTASMSAAAFQRLMTQKAISPSKDFPAWRAELQLLVERGTALRFPVVEVLLEMASEVDAAA